MKKWNLLKTLALALVLGGIMAAGACNTMEGAGKDVKDAGNAIEDAAD